MKGRKLLEMLVNVIGHFLLYEYLIPIQMQVKPKPWAWGVNWLSYELFLIFRTISLSPFRLFYSESVYAIVFEHVLVFTWENEELLRLCGGNLFIKMKSNLL